MSWNAYRVTVTRLVEEECEFYVRAENESAANGLAVSQAEEVAEAVWMRTDCGPHTYSVDKCEEADKPKEFT